MRFHSQRLVLDTFEPCFSETLIFTDLCNRFKVFSEISEKTAMKEKSLSGGKLPFEFFLLGPAKLAMRIEIGGAYPSKPLGGFF